MLLTTFVNLNNLFSVIIVVKGLNSEQMDKSGDYILINTLINTYIFMLLI